jgi:cytochrome b
MSKNDALIWDWPLRAFHWVLAVCVAASWATHYAGLEWFEWHQRVGCVTLVLVAFRLLWGIVGTRHSRFATFVHGPRIVWRYLREAASQEAPGHNPLGGWSTLALLAVLATQAITGLFANDAIANAGPFYGWVSPATSDRLTGIHHVNANVLLTLVGLHVLAIAWYDVVRRRGLSRAMLTGRKPGAHGIAGSRGMLAVALVTLLAVALLAALRAAPEATFSGFF